MTPGPLLQRLWPSISARTVKSSAFLFSDLLFRRWRGSGLIPSHFASKLGSRRPASSFSMPPTPPATCTGEGGWPTTRRWARSSMPSGWWPGVAGGSGTDLEGFHLGQKRQSGSNRSSWGSSWSIGSMMDDNALPVLLWPLDEGQVVAFGSPRDLDLLGSQTAEVPHPFVAAIRQAQQPPSSSTPPIFSPVASSNSLPSQPSSSASTSRSPRAA